MGNTEKREADSAGPYKADRMAYQRIIGSETSRANARTDSLALEPKAQLLQDLLDHMIYRMAGLTDADIAGLESRLARML